MRIIEPSVSFLDCSRNISETIEKATRNCYKSEDKIKPGSAEKLFNQVVRQHHHDSVCEHGLVTVQIVTDRAVMAQMTRHRIGFSYSIESQRYVNYSRDKFGSEIKCIPPRGLPYGTHEFDMWLDAMNSAEEHYMNLIEKKIKPEIARSVLPNSTAVTMTVSANIRAWRHFFELRTSPHAQLDIRELAHMIHDCMLHNGIPAYLFSDIMEAK